MRFIVSATSLLKQLQLVSGVIGASSILPILENFLFEIEGNLLKITASDLETSMKTSLPIEATDDGSIAIPAKILLETLKTFAEQPLTFEINTENFGIEITSENGKFKLAGENGEDYPRIPELEESAGFDISPKILQNAIAKTIFAVSTDELRPAMSGVFFSVEETSVTFVGTDAHKLVRYTRTDTGSPTTASFIVPRKALGLLKNGLAGDDSLVHVSYNQTNAFFKTGNVDLICRLIDARFPNYNAVIPADNQNRVIIGRTELLNTLKRISIFSNKTTHQIMMRITGNEMEVSAQDLDFSNEAKEHIFCTHDGEDIEVGFNSRFLIEMLNALELEEISFLFGQHGRAALLLPPQQEPGEDLLMLLMPIMMQ